MAEWWPNQLAHASLTNYDDSGQTLDDEGLQWQHQNTDPLAHNTLAATAPPWQGRLASEPERAPWSSQVIDPSGNHSQEGMSPNEPFPDLPYDIPDSAFPYGSGQTTAKATPRQSPSREVEFRGYASGESTAKPSRRQSPSGEAGNDGNSHSLSSTAGRLGLGWPSSYHPPISRPWHYQHPSVIDNHYLLATCDRYDSIFPGNHKTFVPQNTPWFTHWMIAFWAQKTRLTRVECCMVFRYKYRDVIPDIQYLREQHVVDLWNYLRRGEHTYAFEWERNEGFEDSLGTLLDVWLSEACRPQEWQREERKFRYRAVLNGADY